MKRIFKIGTGTVVATSMLATLLAFAGPGAASATVQRQPTSAARQRLQRAPVPRGATRSRGQPPGIEPAQPDR